MTSVVTSLIQIRSDLRRLQGLKQMMRKLLAEQFKLVLHQESRSLPVFELRTSRTDGTLGPNMIPAKTSCETTRFRDRNASPFRKCPFPDQPIANPVYDR